MPQLFSRRSNSYSKTIPLFVGAFPFVLAWALVNTTPWTHATGQAP